MKKMRIKGLWLAILLLFVGCSAQGAGEGTGGKIRVVATLFPQYDFARQIAGDAADVTLLMPPGMESHTYEPTPADIARIRQANLLIYTGPQMEPWAQTLFEGTPSVRLLDVSRGVALDKEGHSADDGHSHTFDPHIWTSPLNAKVMADNITVALCEADPGQAGVFRTNNAALQGQLDALDAEFRSLARDGKRKDVVFGGRFAFHYLMEEYGLTPIAAYDSCSAEAEPSARTVAAIIDRVRADGIPVVYYEELSDPKVARAIREETGAEMLLLHSCHNVSREGLKGGETYLSLMWQNAANLKRGLAG